MFYQVSLENPPKEESSKGKVSELSPIIFNGHINYVSDFNECAMICDDLM